MSTCFVVLTHHVPRGDQEELIRDYRDNIGTRLRTERGFRQLQIIQSANDPQLLLVLMEWTGDHLFHYFANKYLTAERYQTRHYRLFTTYLSVQRAPRDTR